MRLYSTACNTDFKGRPDHRLEVLGEGTFEELTAVADRDVARWQADEIKNDREIAEDDGEDPGTVPDTWPVAGRRWEMDQPVLKSPPRLPMVYRVFAWCSGEDGDNCSVAYHLRED